MGFNQAQKKAVTHGKGPCLVLAGPGSGKTLTIVNRIKYLIEEYKVRPEEILVVTFTRFAAAEMKSRLCALMGRKDLPVTSGTFHGIYYGILKWAYRMGQQNILSEEEKYQILRAAVSREKMEIFDEEDFIQDLAAEIIKGTYEIRMSDSLAFKVESAGILKRALKEIDALGGDYVSVLLKGAEI